MEKRKKFAMITSTLGILLIILGVTYSFFNYTRTGVSNTIKVGRISFNSNQSNTVTLLNVFPIDKNDVNDSTDVAMVNVDIEGDTTYDEGVEYVLTVSNLTNTVGNKKLPIDVEVIGYQIGTNDEDYFDNRGGNSSIYKVLKEGSIINNDPLLVGYITKGQTGIDGNVTIKAYLDKDKIAISDTYLEETSFAIKENPSEESINSCITFFSNMNISLQSGESYENFCRGTGTIMGMDLQSLVNNGGYNSELLEMGILINWTNGTTDTWVAGRRVFTAAEWNSLQTNGVSFQVKVEANEGVWVENPIVCKRATTLHTEKCARDSAHSGCREDGYEYDSDIAYGNMGTTGEKPSVGDAFDCNVDGSGYNKRFYYVSDYYDTHTTSFDNEYATLVYSEIYSDNDFNSGIGSYALNSDVESAGGTCSSTYGCNWYGPATAIKYLPTTNTWNNIELKDTERAILAESVHNHNESSIGSYSDIHYLPTNFSYSGKSARLITIQEVMRACDIEYIGNTTTGEIPKKCNFFFEGTMYADQNKDSFSIMTETPLGGGDNYRVNILQPSARYVYSDSVGYSQHAIKPVIDVPYSKIDY